MIKKIFSKCWRSRFNVIRRVFRKLVQFLINRYNLFDIPIDVQTHNMMELGLRREDGLIKLNSILTEVMSKSYHESDGMFSEHLILISSISIANSDIKRVLEIGTHDGRAALILAHLFPDAEIISIDLPSDVGDFVGTYGRQASVKEFIKTRDQNIAKGKNIKFRELNSLGLSEWEKKFDLIWIDGAHGYPVVAMDVINSWRLANKGAFVLIDDIWKSVGSSDSMYKSIAGFEALNALVDAGLISKYSLIHKRLGGVYNYPGRKKYVGCFIK